MRFLININNLRLCNKLPLVKSCRSYRWYQPAIKNATGSNVVKFNSNQTLFCSNALRSMSISAAGGQNDKHRAAEESHPDGITIYQGKNTRQFLRVKLFSLTTSLMGLFAQPILWLKGIEVSGGTGLSIVMCSVAGIFIFVTPVLLHLVTKKYVIDIKYNAKTDEYTLMTISFFLFKNTLTFKVEDIEVPDVETMFTSMKVGPKKVPVFVDAASFYDTHHYARFMGYDKPLDFRLDGTEINQTDAKTAQQTLDRNKSTQTPNK